MHYISTALVLSALCLCTKSSVTTDYCSKVYEKLCHKKGIHVACEFPYPGPGESCNNYTKVTMDADMQDVILHYVNWQRQKVALGKVTLKNGAELPQPRYMNMVKWSNELASLAQRLADQCLFTHDECRSTVPVIQGRYPSTTEDIYKKSWRYDSNPYKHVVATFKATAGREEGKGELEHPYAGQTIGEVRYRRSPARTEVTRGVKLILKAWWRERKSVEPEQLFDGFQLAKNRGIIWGDFSQLAIQTLSEMGCGANVHGRAPKLLFVCDFSTTNMLGEPTLSDGPIGPCPNGMRRDEESTYPLLCQSKIPQEQYEVKQDYDSPEPVADTERSSDVMTRRQFNIRPDLDDSLAISKLRQKVVETEKLVERPVLYFGRNQNFNEERPVIENLPESRRLSVKTTRKWPQHKLTSKKVYSTTEAKYVQRLWLFPIDKEDVEQIYNDTGFKLPFPVPSRYEHTTLKRRVRPSLA